MSRFEGRGPTQQSTQGPRVNHQIRLREVRVIDDLGNQLGVILTADALALAVQRGLDLVEIAPNQRPPVCRIMDYGKYKYELKKKEQASRKKQHHVQVKELRVRPRIGEHDLQVRVKQAREFLTDGDKVEITCVMRGREVAHSDLAQNVLKHFFSLIQDLGKIERPPRQEGKRIGMLVTPK